MIAKPESALPAPDTESAAHSQRVARHLRALIGRSDDGISFAEFMHEALYARGLGYYSAGAPKFGPAGDFTTAPEISPLFGSVLARQLAAVLEDTGGNILEIGAGTGTLAVQLLSRLASLDALPREYLILEVSPELAERQLALITTEVPDLRPRVRWIDAPPEAFRGIMLANEVADAIPVERFRIDGRRVTEARVVAQRDRFEWLYRPAPSRLERAVRQIEADLGRSLCEGYTSELAPARSSWVRLLARGLERGVILLIDYGMSRREYYAADRGEGWLQCHFRHHVHGDPLILPGIQDITAWVDFTAIAIAAVDAGLTVAGYAPQGPFLLRGGLDVEFAGFAGLPERQQAALSGQAKLLTMPGEMGETFKLIALSRGDCGSMPVFGDVDLAHVL